MTKFVLNQEVPFDEGLDCEFKSFTFNPVELIKDCVDQYVVAYLNRGIAGSIFFGIKDDGLAVGISLDRKERDDVRKGIDQKLRSITPLILPSSYEVESHHLFSASTSKNPIPDQPIIEVKVKRVSPRQVFFVTGLEGKRAFIKTPSGIGEVKTDRLIELQKEIQTGQENREKQKVPHHKPPTAKPPKAPADSTPFVNPYNTAAIATKDMFKGREAEIEHLRYAIKNGTHTAIFGLQRMGKTSLVKETLSRVDENCVFAEVDLQTYGGERITYRALLHAIVTRIAEKISSSRHQSVVNEIDELARTYMRGDKHQMLDGFSAILEKTVKATRRKVVLFLDEFSELCQTIDKNEDWLKIHLDRDQKLHPHEMIVDVSLMHWFSSLMRNNALTGRLVFIFAVRPFVAEYDADTQLQILKLVSPITLHYLRKSAAEALMVEPLEGKIEYETESINYLYNLTAGHPYLIQFFLHEIINRLQQERRSCIEKQDITRLEGELVSAEEVYEGQFTVLESDYSVESVRSPEAARKGRGVLAVIAYLGDQRGNDGWVPIQEVHDRLTRHRMQEDEIYNVLAKLRRAQIIEETKVDDEKLEYRISIPLLRKRYVRQNMYQRHFPPRNLRQ